MISAFGYVPHYTNDERRISRPVFRKLPEIAKVFCKHRTIAINLIDNQIKPTDNMEVNCGIMLHS